MVYPLIGSLGGPCLVEKKEHTHTHTFSAKKRLSSETGVRVNRAGGGGFRADGLMLPVVA